MWTLLPRLGVVRSGVTARSPAEGSDTNLGGRVVGHRQFGGAQPFDLVAQPCGLLEIEIGGGGAHARFQIGNHRLEIVADGGGVLELAAAPAPVAISTWSRSYTLSRMSAMPLRTLSGVMPFSTL